MCVGQDKIRLPAVLTFLHPSLLPSLAPSRPPSFPPLLSSSSLTSPELQALAKKMGVKANLKTAQLIAQIRFVKREGKGGAWGEGGREGRNGKGEWQNPPAEKGRKREAETPPAERGRKREAETPTEGPRT